MLDHTENQRLHDLIVHVAPLLPGPVSSVPALDPDAEEPDPPFMRARSSRTSIAFTTAWPTRPTNPPFPPRQLIAGTVTADRSVCPPFDTGKVRRILDRVRSRLAADTIVSDSRRGGTSEREGRHLGRPARGGRGIFLAPTGCLSRAIQIPASRQRRGTTPPRTTGAAD